jgi:hypothetical protein
LESPVVTVVLWVAAVAGLVWVLTPAIAFAAGAGGLKTSLLLDVGPPTMHSDESVFGARLRELAALDFRLAGRTRERARFPSPGQWRWQSYQPAQWLTSPDGNAHATLYRLVPGEPARISFITVFDDGGLVRTACPGPLPMDGPDNYRMMAVRGADAAALLALHRERVTACENERGVRVRPATIPEITAIDDAFGWAYMRKLGRSAYMGLAPLLVCAPIALIVALIHPAVWTVPLAICVAIGAHAVGGWALHRLIVPGLARRAHTADITAGVGDGGRPPDDVAEDGTILATGGNERLLRRLAWLAAALAAVWPITFVPKLTTFAAGSALRLVFGCLPFVLGALVAAQLVGRARGRMLFSNRGRRDPANVWLLWMLLNIVFASGVIDRGSSSASWRPLALAGLSLVLGLAGQRLEKKRGA